MTKTNAHYVADMIEYGQRAIQYMAGSDARQLSTDQMRGDAILHALLVMGEACKQIEKSVTNRFATVPWRKIAGTRDKLAHDYDEIDWALIQTTVALYLPPTLVELCTIRDILFTEQQTLPEIPADDR